MCRIKLEPAPNRKDHLVIDVQPMDANTFSETIDFIRSFPNRRFDMRSHNWVVPNSPENFEHLKKWPKQFYEVSVDCLDYIKPDYRDFFSHKKVEINEALNMWDYVFDDSLEINIPFTPRVPSYRHQLLALKFIHEAQYFGLIWEMGTGKSKVIVDELAWLTEEGQSTKCLIMAPKGLIYNWKEEIKKYLPEDTDYFISHLSSGEKLVMQLREGIASSAKLKIFLISIDSVKGNLPALTTMKFDMGVLDESHRIKDARTRRSKAALNVSGTCKRKFILTGTFVGNKPSDMFQQIRFLKLDFFGKKLGKDGKIRPYNFSDFKNQYDDINLNKDPKEIAGKSRLREIKDKMQKFTLIVSKKDCLDLPDKTYSVVTVQMTEKQQSIYDQMTDFLFAEIEAEGEITESRAQIHLVQMLRLTQICCGYLKDADSEPIEIDPVTPKILELEKIVSEHEENFIVWCRFRKDIELVSDLFEDMKISFGVINGDVKIQDRHTIANEFNEGKLKAIIAEPACAGEGLTLIGSKSSPCSLVIRYSSDFSLIKRLQSEDRCHRIGMHKSVHYIDLVCENSIEVGTLRILQNKINLNEAMKDLTSIRELVMR